MYHKTISKTMKKEQNLNNAETQASTIPVVSSRNCKYCVPMYQNGTSTTTFVTYNCSYHNYHVSIQNIDNFRCNCYYGS